MPSTNDITGDKLKSKPNSQEYRDNFDNIFKPKAKQMIEELKEIENEFGDSNDE